MFVALFEATAHRPVLTSKIPSFRISLSIIPMSWNFKLRHWWILGAASIIQYILVGYGCIGKCDGTPPESQLLKMQRFYSRENPHDNRLYTTLGVLSNATASDITKAYRLRSRELHPDKRSHFSKSQNDAPLNEDGNAAVGPDLDEELELVRQAYDILKDDRTRCGFTHFIFFIIP